MAKSKIIRVFEKRTIIESFLINQWINRIYIYWNSQKCYNFDWFIDWSKSFLLLFLFQIVLFLWTLPFFSKCQNQSECRSVRALKKTFFRNGKRYSVQNLTEIHNPLIIFIFACSLVFWPEKISLLSISIYVDLIDSLIDQKVFYYCSFFKYYYYYFILVFEKRTVIEVVLRWDVIIFLLLFFFQILLF